MVASMSLAKVDADAIYLDITIIFQKMADISK